MKFSSHTKQTRRLKFSSDRKICLVKYGVNSMWGIGSLTLSTSKACIFTHPFERASGVARLVLLGNRHEHSLSAQRQVLIKKSGRTIERLAPNSEVVNLKCFSIQVAFIYPFIC